MKTRPIEPAQIDWSGPVPRAPRFDDVYHPAVGAAAQAEHVFLRGNGLPGRWRGRAQFTILETGFGLGHNFLAAWRAWRGDAARCRRLFFVSIDKHPPRRDDLARAHAGGAEGGPAAAGLAAQLVSAWPPLTHDLHLLDFEGGALRLLLAFGDAADWLGALRCRADAFFLDGFAPDRNPLMWRRELLAALGRRAAGGATAATWSVAREVREGLAEAGFEVERADGVGGKREISVARLSPRFAALWARRAPPDPALDTSAAREAVVVGAGLAGAALAHALAAAGFDTRVIERREDAALESSGNPAAIVHGVLGADDGPHARLLRAAALHARRCFGLRQGLLWLDRRSDLAAMQRRIATFGAPPDYVQALDAAAAGARAGLALPGPAWFYPGGGFVDPRAWVHGCLRGLALQTGAEVARIERAGDRWRLLDASGLALAEAPLVVLANAASAARLVPGLPALHAARGQVSWIERPTPLALPLTGDGYAIPLPDGRLVFGATRVSGDEGTELRLAEQRDNLERLRRLTGLVLDGVGPQDCAGRAALRVGTADRLPVAGAVAAPAGGAARPCLIERERGLFVCTALGSRGATLAPLLGELIAAMASGAPWPLGQDLVDAVDPARASVRAARRTQP
jgi:tRNA 5-methylaminomethyl-2-thiouridine biosynthesis bifunctional protein